MRNRVPFWSGSRAVQDAIGPYWLCNILNVFFAHKFEFKRKFIAYRSADGFGDADSTGVRKALQPRSNVHAVTIDIASVLNYVAQVDADAKLDPALDWEVDIARVEFVLNGNSRRHGINHGIELGKDCVPSEMHYLATVGLDSAGNQVEVFA